MRSICVVMTCAGVLGWGGSVRADLLGYWPLQGNAVDASGRGHDGTISGSVTPATDRFRNPSGAMYFGGGSGDRIDVGDPLDFQISGAMTITAWVYLDNANPLHNTRNSRIIAKMAGSGRRSWSTGIEKNVSGVPLPATLQVASNGSTVVGISDDAALPAGQWVHYAGAYTPGTSLDVYLNGNLAISRTSGVPATQYSTNSTNVYIGNRPGAGDCGWYGMLDEVRIYSEALSESQIESIMWGLSAGDPVPADRAERVAVDMVLGWRAPDAQWLVDPNTAAQMQYVVYLDPNEVLVTAGDASVSAGPQAEPSLDPGVLALGTKYFWRVDVIDPNGPTVRPGVIWSFTTVPPKAGLISPANGAVDVAQNAVLKWDPGFGAIAHDVYFGADVALVAAGDASVYVGRQSGTTLDPDLAWQAQYFWRIDEVFPGNGAPEQGDVWSFMTGSPVCESGLGGDVNSDCVVNFEDLALMAGDWLICNLTNGDCP